MQLPKYFVSACALTLLAASSNAQVPAPSGENKEQASVRSISVVSNNPLQLRIQTTRAVSAQTQMVSGPERLVIDIPNATPGAGLHGIDVHDGEVKKVRISLFTMTPPTTRIVIDLGGPQWYRVAPDASGLVVSLGSDAESAANPQPTIRWVSATVPAVPVRHTNSPFVVPKRAATQPQAMTN